jgi:outer membrane protein assembly factor BamB
MGRAVAFRIRVALLVTVLATGAAACSGSGEHHQSATAPAATVPGTAAASPNTTAPGSTQDAPGSSAAPHAAPPDWPTYHGNPARTGVSSTMPTVRGALRIVASLKLDAAVYASPIVAGGRTIVATENDTVYAFDNSGRQLWKRSLGAPARRSELPCGNIDPSGITGTPIADPATGVVYVVAEHGHPVRHELVAVSLTTGAVHWRRSVDLPGTAPDAMQERGALTIAGGRVWVPFGGRSGDCGDYKGRVVGVPVGGSGALVSYTVPTTREAGIWTPPGPSVDARGHLYVAVGNGASGVGDPYDHSDSVLELSTAARLLDSFSPTTWATDNESDLDLGSQGPALVGPWVFTAGKSGTGYVLRRGHLGGIGGQVSKASVCMSFGGTAVSGSVVYVPCTDGLRAVRIDTRGGIHGLWHAAESIAGSPVVGGGRVWSLDQDAGVLHALNPATGRSLEQVRVGTTSRFATPALYRNHVLVPTMTGLVIVAA